MTMKALVPIILCVATGIIELLADGNLVRNGNFEDGIEGWKYVVENGRATLFVPELLAWEQKDTAGGSKGSLKVTIPSPDTIAEKTGGYRQKTHGSGTACPLQMSIKAGENIKVRFAAKSLDGSTWLHVCRHNEGKSAAVVELESDWKTFEVTLLLDYDTAALLFGLVKNSSRNTAIEDMVEGTFLLDNVEVLTIDN